MVTLESLTKDVEQIKARNKRVELDKEWETSFFRKVLLVLFTYLSIGLYMFVIKVENPWLNAVIPSIGFLLSTLTLPFFKDYWMKRHKKF
jgi:hypothetical protein